MLISFYCVWVVSFYFSLFSYFFVESATCWGTEVSLAILIIQYLNNQFGLVWEKLELNLELSLLASQNYFLQSICAKLIYQFLYPNNGYLFVRCLVKVFEEERNGNRKENSPGVTTRYWRQKKDRKVKDRNDQILGFELVFVG